MVILCFKLSEIPPWFNNGTNGTVPDNIPLNGKHDVMICYQHPCLFSKLLTNSFGSKYWPDVFVIVKFVRCAFSYKRCVKCSFIISRQRLVTKGSLSSGRHLKNDHL